jgi:hypothetical protein
MFEGIVFVRVKSGMPGIIQKLLNAVVNLFEKTLDPGGFLIFTFLASLQGCLGDVAQFLILSFGLFSPGGCESHAMILESIGQFFVRGKIWTFFQASFARLAQAIADGGERLRVFVKPGLIFRDGPDQGDDVLRFRHLVHGDKTIGDLRSEGDPAF